MTQAIDQFNEETAEGKRYRFGENWARFIELVDERRIGEAEQSLYKFFGERPLDGKSFLDIGSGSGLFSLAARRLGATVYSFDFDPCSVECTCALKEKFFPVDERWSISRNSVLDDAFMSALPQFDLVYSWGVLHHTGDMKHAIRNACQRVRPGGLLYLALYRKTWLCPLWRLEKRIYCSSPDSVRKIVRHSYGAAVRFAFTVRGRVYSPKRGMDAERDLDDWLGGYPYESITPRKLRRNLAGEGFALRSQTIKAEGVHITPGCDEYLFERVSA